MTIDILSLCSGIGALDLATEKYFGGNVKVFCETDKNASAVLGLRFPGIPNIGDWTDLHTFDGFDVVVGGLPCQPVSAAGSGKGEKDERYLYDDFVRILSQGKMRPAIVLENVRGFMFARHAELFWRLIKSLAKLGYIGQYGVVRASDAGAPHRRERWFYLATHRECVGWRERARFSQGQSPAFGWDGFSDYDRKIVAHTGSFSAELRRRPRPVVKETQTPSQQRNPIRNTAGDSGETITDFGEYSEAVNRWGLILGRGAPAPLGTNGRLSPAFVEWMMGLDAGWVSDVDISHKGKLRLLGNAVVPQQAALALELLGEQRF